MTVRAQGVRNMYNLRTVVPSLRQGQLMRQFRQIQRFCPPHVKRHLVMVDSNSWTLHKRACPTPKRRSL